MWQRVMNSETKLSLPGYCALKIHGIKLITFASEKAVSRKGRQGKKCVEKEFILFFPLRSKTDVMLRFRIWSCISLVSVCFSALLLKNNRSGIRDA